jgi:hypothetical protein
MKLNCAQEGKFMGKRNGFSTRSGADLLKFHFGSRSRCNQAAQRKPFKKSLIEKDVTAWSSGATLALNTFLPQYLFLK